MSHLQQQEALLGSPSGKQPSSFSLSPHSLDSRCPGVSREALRSSEKSHKTEPTGKHPQALVCVCGVLVWGGGSSGRRRNKQKNPCGLGPCATKTGSPGEGTSRLGCDSKVGICVTLTLEHRWSVPHLDVSLSSAPSPGRLQNSLFSMCL